MDPKLHSRKQKSMIVELISERGRTLLMSALQSTGADRSHTANDRNAALAVIGICDSSGSKKRPEADVWCYGFSHWRRCVCSSC
jgi:hypothetical protein